MLEWARKRMNRQAYHGETPGLERPLNSHQSFPAPAGAGDGGFSRTEQLKSLFDGNQRPPYLIRRPPPPGSGENS